MKNEGGGSRQEKRLKRAAADFGKDEKKPKTPSKTLVELEPAKNLINAWKRIDALERDFIGLAYSLTEHFEKEGKGEVDPEETDSPEFEGDVQ